ncbi:MAG: sugar ABC transporter permease, partial [Agromyces sp.]
MSAVVTDDRQPFGGGGPYRLVDRVRGAHLSMLPALGALALVWLVLGVIDPAFLSAENLVNLTLQSAPVGVIALGVV